MVNVPGVELVGIKIYFYEGTAANLCSTKRSNFEFTEVQGIGFVGYTRVKGGRPRLWNLQNLCLYKCQGICFRTLDDGGSG